MQREWQDIRLYEDDDYRMPPPRAVCASVLEEQAERERFNESLSRYTTRRLCAAIVGDGDDAELCDQKAIRGGDRCLAHKRWCQGYKPDGSRCESPPLRDYDWCAAHNPALPADQRFGSPAQASAAGKLGGGSNRYPRLHEVVARKIEEQADEIVGAGLEAIYATKPVLIERTEQEGGRRTSEQEVVEYPDHLVRLKAFEALTNRGMGKPHQALDISQETRQLNLNIDATDPDVREKLHGFLRSRPPVEA